MRTPRVGFWRGLRQLVARFSLPQLWFTPRILLVKFVVDRVALGQVFLWFFAFPLSVSFHSCSIFTQSSWWMDNGSISGHSSTEI
jgi:hypothetical protein